MRCVHRAAAVMSGGGSCTVCGRLSRGACWWTEQQLAGMHCLARVDMWCQPGVVFLCILLYCCISSMDCTHGSAALSEGWLLHEVHCVAHIVKLCSLAVQMFGNDCHVAAHSFRATTSNTKGYCFVESCALCMCRLPPAFVCTHQVCTD